MKNTACLLFILFSFSLSAQTNLDSLLNVWNDSSKSDSLRINAFQDYIWKGFLFSQPDSALILTDTLLDFAKNNNSVRSTALYYKGAALFIKSNYSNSLANLKESILLSKELEDKKKTANTLNLIGNIYNVQGNYPKALDHYDQSLKIKKNINDKWGIAAAMSNIGGIYSELNDSIKTREYYQLSLAIFKEINDQQGIAGSSLNYGSALGKKDSIKKLSLYKKSLEIFKKIGDNQGVADNYTNIGNLHLVNKNYKKALYYHNKGLNIEKKIGNKQGIASSLYSLGTINLETKNYFQTIENCKKSFELSKTVGGLLLQKKACECLYETYKKLGNGNKALEYHEQVLALNDSLKSEETTKKLQQMEFAKQVLADSLLQVEKDLQIEMAHKEEVRKKDKNRNLALGAGIFFLVLSGGFYSRWRYVKKSKAIIEKEKDRSDNLLLNILPAEIAEELKEKGSADARDFDLVSILFTDFKGFTEASEKLSAQELIHEINECFMAFDHICEKYKIEKIKTIGDAYMAAGGLPIPTETSIKNTVLAALEMQEFITKRINVKEAENKAAFKMRLGIHTGPVVAGIVGVKKFQYDIWGDTVNTASRMESSGEIGKVNISEDTCQLLKNDSLFTFKPRGKIQAKGKGEMKMFFVEKVS
ncbi:adenylate/guanylate cyclase domain-containing protein [uncultured Croceitalea sp.]|uniref:adenylate/guanylate cyclase domain-containing protein n=1 Tax=uncultured Croceitalea sp. TaxID=1798908 RepID=UPI00374E5A9E